MRRARDGSPATGWSRSASGSTRGSIYDAAGGSAKTINFAPKVDWTRWRYVEADEPAGLQMSVLAGVRREYLWRSPVLRPDPRRRLDGKVARDVTGPETTEPIDPRGVTG